LHDESFINIRKGLSSPSHTTKRNKQKEEDKLKTFSFESPQNPVDMRLVILDVCLLMQAAC
jgi:hypothetical protein